MERTEHTQKWLDALRSGEYKQGKYRLTNDITFCCLGVAAEVCGLWQEKYDATYEVIYSALGIERMEAQKLMDMNDLDDKPFTEIADEIEKMLDVSN